MGRFCSCFDSSTIEEDEPGSPDPLPRRQTYKLVPLDGGFTATDVYFFTADSPHTVKISFEDGEEERSLMKLIIDDETVHVAETASNPNDCAELEAVGRKAHFIWDVGAAPPEFKILSFEFRVADLAAGMGGLFYDLYVILFV